MPIMDPEQYLIADEMCILDVSKGERELGWVPQYRDEDMLIAAYTEYRKNLAGAASSSLPNSKAA
jgi:dTDP-glucose 4,6-dehydratase